MLKGPVPLSDSVLPSGQLLRELNEVDKWNRVFYISSSLVLRLSLTVDRRFKAPMIYFLIQSCDQISWCGKPVERTKEIGFELLLVRSTGFKQRMIGQYDLVRSGQGGVGLGKDEVEWDGKAAVMIQWHEGKDSAKYNWQEHEHRNYEHLDCNGKKTNKVLQYICFNTRERVTVRLQLHKRLCTCLFKSSMTCDCKFLSLLSIACLRVNCC